MKIKSILIVVLIMGTMEAKSSFAEKQTGYAPVNGLRIYYEIHGSPTQDQIPLVLLHGGGSTIETSFGKILPALAKHRQIIAFEQQGHGHTADVDRPFTFEQSAEDTVGLLRYLKIDKADLFGYSNGGHIALQTAISHPEVIRKMIIESAMYSREGCDPGFWESFKTAKLSEMPKELQDAYLASAPQPQNLQSFFEKCVKRMLEFKGWTPQQIQSIKVPVLILIGDHDIVRPEHAVSMFRLLPGAQLSILPGTDHMAITNSDQVAPIVETFLECL